MGHSSSKNQKETIAKLLENYEKIIKTKYPEYNDSFLSYKKQYLQQPNKKVIIRGACQLGKTIFIGIIAGYRLIQGYSTIFVVRNKKNDKLDAMSKIKQTVEYYKKELESIPCGEFKNSCDYSVIEDVLDFKNSEKDEKKMKRILQGKVPKIIVTLNNKHSLKKILEIADKTPSCRFDLQIDEIDYNDPVTPLSNNEERKAQEMLNLLKEKSKTIIGITATPLEVIISRGFKKDEIFEMQIPKNYRSFDGVKINSTEGKNIPCTRILDDPFEKVDFLLDFLEICSKEPLVDGAPFLGLINIGSSISSQNIVVERGCEEYKNLTFIIYNGNDIILKGKGLPKANMHNDFFDTTFKRGIHTLKKRTEIGNVIACFESMGTNKISNIVVVSGNLAGRGTSFCSSMCRVRAENNLPVTRCTKYLLIISKKLIHSNVIQVSSRLCGVFPTDPERVLYTNYPQDVKNCYYLSKETLDRSCSSSSSDEEIKDVIKNLPISKHKYPSKARGLNSGKIGTQVEDDSAFGGHNWASQVDHKDETKVENKNEHQDEANYEIVYKVYKNKDKIVHKLIKLYLDNPGKAFDIPTLKDKVYKNFKIDNYDKWDNQYHKYLILVKSQKGKTFSLNPGLEKYLKIKL